MIRALSHEFLELPRDVVTVAAELAQQSLRHFGSVLLRIAPERQPGGARRESDDYTNDADTIVRSALEKIRVEDPI